VTVSPWARGLFGEHAEAVQKLIPEVLRRAHEFAAAAQSSSGTEKKDPYGHTLKNTQHECLVAGVAGQLPGSFTVFRPNGATYELVRFPETGVVLYPWRYGTSSADRRESARMQPSGTRQELLSGVAADSRQLTIDHARLSEQEVDAQLADDAAVMEELRTLARVVVVAYASNPKSLLSVGWGEADLTDERGSVHWRHWETLRLLPDSGKGDATANGSSSPPSRPLLRPVEGITTVPGAQGPCFDDPALDNDLGLQPRRTHSGEPSYEPDSVQQLDAGTDEPAADNRP